MLAKAQCQSRRGMIRACTATTLLNMLVVKRYISLYVEEDSAKHRDGSVLLLLSTTKASASARIHL